MHLAHQHVLLLQAGAQRPLDLAQLGVGGDQLLLALAQFGQAGDLLHGLPVHLLERVDAGLPGQRRHGPVGQRRRFAAGAGGQLLAHHQADDAAGVAQLDPVHQGPHRRGVEARPLLPVRGWPARRGQHDLQRHRRAGSDQQRQVGLLEARQEAAGHGRCGGDDPHPVAAVEAELGRHQPDALAGRDHVALLAGVDGRDQGAGGGCAVHGGTAAQPGRRTGIRPARAAGASPGPGRSPRSAPPAGTAWSPGTSAPAARRSAAARGSR
jgi:hypothetical protein